MPTKSRWEIPIPDATLPTFLFTSPSHPLSDKPTHIDADNPTTHYLTHNTLRLWSQRLALGLVLAGLKPGDPVMLYSGNTIFFPVVLIGVIMAGGIFTAANPAYNEREVAYQLQNSGARFLICAEGAALDVGLKGAAIAKVERSKVFVFDDGIAAFEGRGKASHGCKHWSTLLAPEKDAEGFQWRTGADKANETICLNYSSGTTGLPKGVMITHKNYVSNAMQHMMLAELRPTFREQRDQGQLKWMCFLPMYHAMAQTIFCVGTVSKGIPVYVYRKFEFTKMLEGIQQFRITDLNLVPPIVVAMAKRPETRRYDLSSVQTAGSGAAPLGREVTVEFEKLWPDGIVNLKQGYGMTEVTCSCLGWDPRKTCADFSVGEPNANCEVKLMNPEDSKTEVPDGERGEIWVRAPNVMKGYWKNEKATRETIMPGGWLRTGDVAYKDEHGHFFVVDRLKELIKVKGMQVAPAELEAQLLEHPAVQDAAVIGVEMNGDEAPRAYIVPAAGQNPDPTEVAEFMKKKVSKHKWLTGGVIIVEEIKKNPSGKILRRYYRDLAKQETASGPKGESRL